MQTTLSTTFTRNYTSGSNSIITLSVDAANLPDGVSPFMDYAGFYNLAIGPLSQVMFYCATLWPRGTGVIEFEDSFDFGELTYSVRVQFQPHTTVTLEDPALTETAKAMLLDATAAIHLKLRAAHMIQQRKLATR